MPLLRSTVILLSLLFLTACTPVRPIPGGAERPVAPDAAAEPATEPAAGASDAAPVPGDTTGTAGANSAADTAAANMKVVLARQLGVDPAEVTVVSTEAVEWPDACLGVNLEGEMCAQVITPGHKIVLTAGGATYTFHTDQAATWYRLVDGPAVDVGDPIATWRGLADNGSCLEATFGATGVAFGPCGGVMTQGRYVSPARLAALTELAATYAPVDVQTGFGALTLRGSGTAAPTPEQQEALDRWLQTAAVEATGGQSLAGMTYEGPAELGSDDASRCAVLQISGTESTVFACDGTVTTAPLAANLATAWADMADRLGGFTYETPTERLTFGGMGLTGGEAWQRALLAWARTTRAELATGQASATARTALSWRLGGVPDMPEVCAHLTVLDYGYAYGEQRACESGEIVAITEDWLTDAELAQFDRWLYAYAPLAEDDNYLNGVGTEPMPAAKSAAVQTFAEELWQRLTGLPVVPAETN